MSRDDLRNEVARDQQVTLGRAQFSVFVPTHRRCRRMPGGGRVRQCRAPGEASDSSEAGNRPERFIRASSVNAFWL
jgi:hypothetical protein